MKKFIALLLLSGFVHATQIGKVIEKSEPKVVKIGVVMEKSRSICSGSFISESGIVLTCAHCFDHEGIKKVFIKTSDGRVMPAQPLMINREKDLALIAPLHYSGKFPHFTFGHKPVMGQQVISMGSPLNIAHTATVGWVSNLSDIAYVYHSAFINPGNSGGPLLDLKGNIIGVNEAVIGYGFLGLREAAGLYIAISLHTIHEFLNFWGENDRCVVYGGVLSMNDFDWQDIALCGFAIVISTVTLFIIACTIFVVTGN